MSYRHAPHVAWRKIAGETIVIDLRGKVMYGLDESAGTLWEAAGETAALAALLARQETPAAVSREDIERFLDELLELGLLERGPEVPHGEGESPAPGDPLGAPPHILWQESIQKVAASCAFLPAQNPLCTQVPMS